VTSPFERGCTWGKHGASRGLYLFDNVHRRPTVYRRAGRPRFDLRHIFIA